MDTLKQTKGFTLIGVMVSLTIAVVIMTAVAGLLLHSERVVRIGKEKLIAASIAREGLELTRAVRDNNWFDPDPAIEWTDELCTGANSRDFIVDTETSGSVNIQDVSGTNTALYVADGMWKHKTSADQIMYSRAMNVDCAEKDNDPSYIIITAAVQWESRGQTRDVIIKEKLYDWYAG